MIYGYARVSTDGRELDAQVKALRAAGAGRVDRETTSDARATPIAGSSAMSSIALPRVAC
jgi:hypothetical protein